LHTVLILPEISALSARPAVDVSATFSSDRGNGYLLYGDRPMSA